MRKPAIRSVARLPEAEVSGSMQTRMVLQSCSSSRRNSSADQGWRKAARSISMTSSRSSDRMRRISNRGRARTATSVDLRPATVSGTGGEGTAIIFERIQDADVGLAPEVGEQSFEQTLVFLPRELLPHAR